jgi:hypothetical protein
MKIRTTIPVMTLLSTTTFTWDVYSLLRFPATGEPPRLAPVRFG